MLTGASYIFMQDKCIDTVGIEMIPRMKYGNTRKFTHFRCHVYFTSSLEYCIYCIPSLSVSFSSMYRTTYWMEIYGIFYNESNRHNGGATTYPSHCHITWDKKFMTFSILRGTCIVIEAHSFVTFLGIDYDEKWVSQISDDRIIVIRFMTKKYVFVA